MSDLDPTDFRRSPGLPPVLLDFGTVAEKRVSSSDTSNSGALKLKSKTSVIYENQEAERDRELKFNAKYAHL